ncbi:HlyIII-domain-containing protein [Venturia nashicola]|uniref:HlyIII-domain-containing protein n=1 Tax=Venturia nashicola TaxID=86259 RepID=A0A4Z1P0Y2_9PEZI|nr:HlyIII-domain-containing protein [Venturia nashicola]
MSAVHGLIINGCVKLNRMMGIDWFMGLAALNLVSMIIYALCIPERWLPRRFDVWGASDQIMHVMVIGGALSHSKGLLRSFAYWQEMHALRSQTRF